MPGFESEQQPKCQYLRQSSEEGRKALKSGKQEWRNYDWSYAWKLEIPYLMVTSKAW